MAATSFQQVTAMLVELNPQIFKKEVFCISSKGFNQRDAYRVMLRKYPDVMNIEQMCDALRISTKTGYKLLHDTVEQRIDSVDCFAPMRYVFVDAMGNLIQPDSVTTGFPQLLKENGLRRIRFHDLRHSCASLLLKEGVPMKQIQEWLGHSDISTTANIYAHLDSQSKNLSARTMANTLTLPKAPSVKEW